MQYYSIDYWQAGAPVLTIVVVYNPLEQNSIWNFNKREMISVHIIILLTVDYITFYEVDLCDLLNRVATSDFITRFYIFYLYLVSIKIKCKL